MHEWGDRWNGEDLSIYSRDDLEPQAGNTPNSRNPHSPAYSESQSSGDEPEVVPDNLKRALAHSSILSVADQPPSRPKGYRAAEAYLRPSPIYVSGVLDNYLFDLKNCTFTMSLTAKAATAFDAPTEIYLPEVHFPKRNTVITASGGRWEIGYQEIQTVKFQLLRWWHGEGEQNVKIEGLKRQDGLFLRPSEEDISYLEQCQRGQCVLM